MRRFAPALAALTLITGTASTALAQDAQPEPIRIGEEQTAERPTSTSLSEAFKHPCVRQYSDNAEALVDCITADSQRNTNTLASSRTETVQSGGMLRNAFTDHVHIGDGLRAAASGDFTGAVTATIDEVKETRSISFMTAEGPFGSTIDLGASRERITQTDLYSDGGTRNRKTLFAGAKIKLLEW